MGRAWERPWQSAIWILLFWELELCASVNHEGRAFLKFRVKEEVDPLVALADWNGEGAVRQRSRFGVWCADERVVDLKAGNGIIRRLLQVDSKENGRSRTNEKNQQRSSTLPAPSPSSLLQQPGQPLSPLFSPSHPHGVSPSPVAITTPIFLPPSPSYDVPASQPSPSPSNFMTPGPLPSLASEDPTYVPLPSPSISILPPSPFLSLPPPTINPLLAGGTNQGKHTNSRTIYMPIIGGISFLLGITILFAFCCRANKVVTVRPWSTGLSGQLQKAFVTGVPALKRSEIEVACEDFSNIIGSLPDCKLYKGTLSSGVEIAVVSSLITSSKDWSKQRESQFREKISMLSKVNHKNFINLLGYCEEEEPFTRIMVFEYAPNGTLSEHLHVKEAEHLDWAARLRIAMGIAYCLDHMHQLNPPVVMKTLDSSSIYLTDDYAAKVSDLGFWSELEETKSSPHWSGTLEVAMPEPKNSVYDFGLLLIEILSGRIPTSKDDILLENWASCYLNGERHVKEMMDPTLALFREEDVGALCEVIRSCLNPNLEERPTMAEVSSRLKDITAMTPDRATPRLSPLWWAELEILTSEVN